MTRLYTLIKLLFKRLCEKRSVLDVTENNVEGNQYFTTIKGDQTNVL